MVASHVLSLPIFEPLSRDRLERLSHVTLGSLRAAIAATTAVSGASSVSEDIESAADLIVQQSVSDFSYTRTLIISTLFSTSFLFLKAERSVAPATRTEYVDARKWTRTAQCRGSSSGSAVARSHAPASNTCRFD